MLLCVSAVNSIDPSPYSVWITVSAHSYSLPLHVLDPLGRLALRVDHEGPAPPASHDDAVLRAEGVARETAQVPIAHRRLLHHQLAEVEVRAARHPQLQNLRSKTKLLFRFNFPMIASDEKQD